MQATAGPATCPSMVTLRILLAQAGQSCLPRGREAGRQRRPDPVSVTRSSRGTATAPREPNSAAEGVGSSHSSPTVPSSSSIHEIFQTSTMNFNALHSLSRTHSFRSNWTGSLLCAAKTLAMCGIPLYQTRPRRPHLPRQFWKQG